MAKNRSKQEPMYTDVLYTKSTKHKSNQYEKCRNEDCEENDNGFCYRYKNRAKNSCKKYR